MFRLESYITSIITGYIDRYISNFKRQDAQVSLWEGDALLQNLDLDLDVLNQELNLPFSLVSGHIHELHIHVPYTKITSEPVVITINTIECVLKLKPPGHEQAPRKKKEKRSTSSSDEPSAGNRTGLLFKVVSNLHITCNNLILKYVEEDIVLSMNIKKLHAVSVDKYWNPMYCALSPENLILRKLITLTDITICLDKRNSLGRIESYLEPILYKCSLKIRISRTFSPLNFCPMKTRIAIHSDDVTISISEPQVPMLLRLILLAKVTFNSSRNGSSLSLQPSEGNSENDGENDEEGESWGTWIWNMLPALGPSSSEDPNNSSVPQSVDIASYIDRFTLNMKLVEEGKTWQSFMKASFEGCFAEMSTNTFDWTNLLCGVALITISPQSTQTDEIYLKCGHHVKDYKKNSLYENPDINLVQRTWDLHISAITEKVLIDRSPAVALDFISSIEMQPENWIDNYPSEPLEKTLMRFVVGNMEVNVTSGLVERCKVIISSFHNYDYPAYSISPNISGEEISLHLRESNSRVLEGLLPLSRYQFTLVEAFVRVFPSTSNMSNSKQRLYNDISKMHLGKKLPYLYLKVKSLDSSYTKPMYPDVLLHLKAHISPSSDLVSASKTTGSISALSINLGVKVDGSDAPDILELYKLSSSGFFNPVFPTGPDFIYQTCTLQLERLSFTSTKAKIMLAWFLIETFLQDNCSKLLYNSTLMQDAIIHSFFPYFQMNINKLLGKFAQSEVSQSSQIKIGSVDAKTYYIDDSTKDHVEVISAASPGELPVFEGVAQRPLNDTASVPFLLYFKLRQFHMMVDSSVFKWLMYMPQFLSQGHIQSWTSIGSGISRKVSSGSVSSLSKKLPEIVEVKEKVEVSSPTPASPLNIDFGWLMKWLSLAVSGEISNIKFSYKAQSEEGCCLHTSVPSVNLSSAQGKFSIDTDSLPIPFGILKKNSVSFPLRLEIMGMSGWSTCGTSSENFFDEFNTTCTVALTSSVVPSPLLSFTLHVDTSHMILSLRRIQMACLTELWANLLKALSILSLSIGKGEEMTVLRERKVSTSEDSASNSQTVTTVINQKANAPEERGLKFSWWLQWTLTKLTISLYTTPLKNFPEFQKLSFDFEDIIASLEVDSVYQKLKMKIGTSTIKHYTKDMKNGNWCAGSFGGYMMCVHESSGHNSEFLSLTLTRANAANLHSRLASLMKMSYKELSMAGGSEERCVIEVVMSVEPLDVIIVPVVMMRFMSIVEPLLVQRGVGSGPPPGPPLTHLTTADLPLVYFDLQQIRIFICSSQTQLIRPDTFVIQVDEIALRSEAVNPVSRKLLRCDISRVTSVPGSRLEDRQYQLDLSLQVMTGRWEELEGHVCGRGDTEENPAVTWNTVGAPQAGRGAKLSTILSKLTTSFIFAPPILSSGVLISGLYFEGNLVSEAEIKLSISDFKLGLGLFSELTSVLPEAVESSFDLDSGIESVDGSLNSSLPKGVERKSSRVPVSHISVSTSTSINTRGIRQRTQVVPSDILLTAKGISFKLFNKDESCLKTTPLLYITIAQPYVSYEKQGDTTVYKASVFDLNIRHGAEGCVADNNLDSKDFVFSLLETREGDTDPYKGIPPALANFKSTALGMKLPSIDFELGRPLKIVLNIPSLKFLKNLQNSLAVTPEETNAMSLSSTSRTLRNKSNRSLYSISDTNVKNSYGNIISACNISTKQLVAEYIPLEADGSLKALLSVNELEGNVTFPGLQISSSLSVKGLVCSLGGNVILTPWSFTSTTNLINESWTPEYVFRMSLFSDILAFEYYKPQINALKSLINELTPFLKAQQTSKTDQENLLKEEDDEEIYLDDLQTGAFQFSSSTGLPLPYQVTFPSPAVMAWAYPYPRTITSITIMPVPFNKPCAGGLDLSLEYLDPLQGWCKWAEGKLTESQVSKLELPQGNRAASLWRVILDTDDLPIQVKALGGSVRVDSLFSRKMITRVQVSCAIDCLSVCLWAKPIECQPLQRFIPVSRLSRYPFSTVSFQSLRLQLYSWQTGQKEVKLEGRPKVQVLNCRTLKDVTVVHPFPLKFLLTMKEDSVRFKLFTDSITAFVAPSITHSIHAALTGLFIQPYIICNDTTYFLSFGQAETMEDIPLYGLQSYFYSWKNSTKKMQLRFSISNSTSNGTKFWSDAVTLGKEGISSVEVMDDGGRILTALIIVKKLSSVIVQVTFTGELMIKNRLDKGLDIRIVASSIAERQRIIRLEGEERCGGILLTKDSSYSLRIAITSGWSGLIPLEEPTSWLVKVITASTLESLPDMKWKRPCASKGEVLVYFVSVPHKGKGNFLSLWCQVLKENHESFKRLLVIISPMYIIKSLLPGDANVTIFTEEFRSEMNEKIPGRGSITNLYAPGTTEHHHSLTFNILGNVAPLTSPHITLSYSDIIKSIPPNTPNFQKALEEDESPEITKENWPLLGSPWDKAEWVDTSQPSTVTRVKVRFCGEKLRVPHCIQLELEPWCLVVNTLGHTLVVTCGEDILCRIPHLSIVAPPYLENTFHLLVKFSDGGFYKSSGFQLSDNQSFYKPHIPGLIPQVATVHFKIQSPNSVLYGVLHSKMAKNIRVLHLTSAFVICNLTSRDLYVAGYSLNSSDGKLVLSAVASSNFRFIPKNDSTNVSEPFGEWMGRDDSTERKLYLIFKGDQGAVGNPVPVPATPDARERETLLLPTTDEDGFFNIPLSIVFQEKEGVTYITIDEDPSPQLLIHNHTIYNLLIGASTTPQGGAAAEESPDWHWRLTLPKGRCGFYRVSVLPGQPLPPLVVAKAGTTIEWSGSISLMTGSGARLIGLPGAQDLVVTAAKIAFTTHLTLTPAHQSLISAADVRTRLSLLAQGGSGQGTVEDIRTEPTVVPELPAYEAIVCRKGCVKDFSIWTNVEGSAEIKSFYFTLCSDSADSPESKEILAISLDDITARIYHNSEKSFGKSDLSVSIWDVQVDNQKYAEGGYDFCVVMTGRGSSSNPGSNVKAIRASHPLPKEGSPTLDFNFSLDVTHSIVLEEVEVKAMPMELFLEDTFLMELKSHFEALNSRILTKPIVSPSKEKPDKEEAKRFPEGEGAPPESGDAPSLFPHFADTSSQDDDVEEWEKENLKTAKIPIPLEIMSSSYELSRPLKLTRLYISPLSLRVSLHTSTKFYIALDQSPLSFAEFKRIDVVTSPYRLGHALTIHYFLGAIYGTGWAIGSLQLLGAPAGLARSLGAGLSSLVSLPCEGLAHGPAGFLFGVLHGSASLMRHVTAGTLSCVTKLAGSWSRTLDRLILSPEDLRYAEEMRRLRPHGLAQGLRQGLTEFGVSFLGGVGGLAQRPLEYALGGGGSLVGSVGRGLVGAMARPLSGAAGLLAVTTQGILAGAGWAHVLKPKQVSSGPDAGSASRLLHGEGSLLVMEGTSSDLQPCDLVLCPFYLKVVSSSEQLLPLSDINAVPDPSDPTLILIYLQNPADLAEKLSQKRIAEFVRDSQRALGSPLPPTPPSLDPEPLVFYLNPENRDYFLSYLQIVARHATNRGFPLHLYA